MAQSQRPNSERSISRRNFLKGTAALAGAATLERLANALPTQPTNPTTQLARPSILDSVNSLLNRGAIAEAAPLLETRLPETTLEALPEDQYVHITYPDATKQWGKRFWPWTFELKRDPSLSNTGLSQHDSDTNVVVVTGPGKEVGFDLKVDTAHIDQTKSANDATLAINILDAQPGDQLVAVDPSNGGVVAVADSGTGQYVGMIVPENGTALQYKLVRADGSAAPSTWFLGSMSNADMPKIQTALAQAAKDGKPTYVADASSGIANPKPVVTPPAGIAKVDVTPPSAQPEATPAPTANSETLQQTGVPVKKITQAQNGEWFRPETANGQPFSSALSYRKIETDPNVTYADNNNLGYVDVNMKNGAFHTSFDVRIEDATKLAELGGDKAAFWVHLLRQNASGNNIGEAGARVQLVDEQNNVLKEVVTQGDGWAGILLPHTEGRVVRIFVIGINDGRPKTLEMNPGADQGNLPVSSMIDAR